VFRVVAVVYGFLEDMREPGRIRAGAAAGAIALIADAWYARRRWLR